MCRVTDGYKVVDSVIRRALRVDTGVRGSGNKQRLAIRKRRENVVFCHLVRVITIAEPFIVLLETAEQVVAEIRLSGIVVDELIE